MRSNHAQNSLTLTAILLSALMFIVPVGTMAQAPEFTAASTGLPTDGSYSFVNCADMNKDGKNDIIAGADQYPSAKTHGLYVWTGDGASWTKSSDGLPTDNNYGGTGIGDLNKDGNPDIVAAFESTWSGGAAKGVGVWLGSGGVGGLSFTAGTGPVTTGSYDSAFVADIDKDGSLDIVGGAQSGIKVWLGNGGGGGSLVWTEKSQGLPTSGEYTGVTAGDVDGDGDLDIAAGNYGGNGVDVWTRNADGSWAAANDGLTDSGTSFHVAFADFNKDSKLDLVTSFRGQGIHLYLGNGGAQGAMKWTESRDGLPTSGGDYQQLGVDDIDGDGNLDILAAYSSGGLHLWKGNGGSGGTLSFTEASGNLPDADTYYGAAFCKINSDNTPDIIGGTWEKGISAWTTSLGPTDVTPPGQVSDLAAMAVGHQNAKLTWTAVGDDGSTGTAAKYDIRYSSSEIKGQNDFNGAFQVDNEPKPQAAGAKESYTVTGLSANSTYYFAVMVYDDGNNPSLLSNVASAKTGAAPANPKPPTITGLTPANNSVVLGIVVVTVTFMDPDNDVNELVITIDGTVVDSKTGVSSPNTFSWDTKNATPKVENGDHIVKVSVKDKAGLTAFTYATYKVSNKTKTKHHEGFIPGFEPIILVAAAAVALAIIGKKGRKDN